ncbi:aldose epimerase family protein [Rickettsiella endosymbiont of Aleochara curtula]|uniref:aldose epimerase family protein n=1 Tax=Rickettsiella endosymbiont of Aleochara curtula TaxID=3077936 RepID=UPI00313BF180
MSKIVCRSSEFGKLADGQLITQYTLCNVNGMSIGVINYGATLTSVKVPDLNGTLRELTLGFDHLDEYLAHDFYFGATIGRVANRIAHAQFNYQKKDYFLSKNKNFAHHLHGGEKGLDKAVWQAEVSIQQDQASVSFFYTSPDGDQGYPGNLAIKTVYTLTLANELKISFQAKTDKATPVDLTNHAYWNLAGAGNGTVLNHVLQIFSDRYIVTDKDLLPTGQIAEVNATPFDFREPHSIGERIKDTAIGGYDVCYVLTPVKKHPLQLVAKIREPTSGRLLEVRTTQPGLQFYTGNSLRDYPISSGLQTQRYGAFCMETQNFPGAVKYSQFPSPFLLPGNVYQHETIYQLIW